MGKIHWWDNSGGFFGRHYMLGDDSAEGYLPQRETLEQRTAREVDGIERLLALEQNSFILDIPAGYGRHSLELARRGHFIRGIDINEEHLAAARMTQQAQGIKHVDFFKYDMRELPWTFHNAHDAVINMFYSFGFFETDEENEQVMHEFNAALKIDGKLLLYTDVSPEIIENGAYKLRERRTLRDGVLYIDEQYDAATKRVNGTWTVHTQGIQTKLTPYSVRIYSAKEFEEMAIRNGFIDVHFFGSFNGAPFTSKSAELIMTARKREPTPLEIYLLAEGT